MNGSGSRFRSRLGLSVSSRHQSPVFLTNYRYSCFHPFLLHKHALFVRSSSISLFKIETMLSMASITGSKREEGAGAGAGAEDAEIPLA